MREDTPPTYDDAERLQRAKSNVVRARAAVETQRAMMAMASAQYQAAVAAYAAAHGGSRRAVAEALGLSDSHLCQLIKQHKLRAAAHDQWTLDLNYRLAGVERGSVTATS